MNTLVTKNIDEIDKYYSGQSDNAQKHLMFTKKNLLQNYLIAYASNEYVIEKVLPQVRIISSPTNGNNSRVEAILETNIFWNVSNELNKPIIGVKSEKHLLILVRENNEWEISTDKYMTDRGHSDEALR